MSRFKPGDRVIIRDKNKAILEEPDMMAISPSQLNKPYKNKVYTVEHVSGGMVDLKGVPISMWEHELTKMTDRDSFEPKIKRHA